jgi:hypothetical protein
MGAPAWLFLGHFGVVYGTPFILIGLVIALPGLAWLHTIKKTGLRHHLLLGAAVAGLLGFLLLATMPNSEAAPGAEQNLNWFGGIAGAVFATPFGLWCALCWWCFFTGRRRIIASFSHKKLMKRHPNDW